MHTVFALLCFVVVIHWLISPYPSGLLHWHCGNLTITPVPAKQPWWIWINTSCEFIMNDCITTTKQSTTKPCAYFLGYTVDIALKPVWQSIIWICANGVLSVFLYSLLRHHWVWMGATSVCIGITFVCFVPRWLPPINQATHCEIFDKMMQIYDLNVENVLDKGLHSVNPQIHV